MTWRWVWVSLLLWSLWGGAAQAGLADRLAQFPDWHKPDAPAAQGDLFYPDWFAGDWSVTTTLVDLAAPIPELATPGFEGNRQYLNQPIAFKVRFKDARSLYPPRRSWLLPTVSLANPSSEHQQSESPQPQQKIVSDRAFNGLSLAKAYLGDAVVSVKVDPTNPNRQITTLRSDRPSEATAQRQLVSTVAAREVETPDPDRFFTTELFLQEFRGSPQLYFNQVETTTDYHWMGDRRSDEQQGEQPGYQPEHQPEYKPEHQPEHQHESSPAITADQVTAIYLSPQDPDFFRAGDSPVALYRYRLEFLPLPNAESTP
jgi:hypothetical protein